jgi:WD40 repeat protein
MTKQFILLVFFLSVLDPIAAQNGGNLEVITTQSVPTLIEIALFGEENRKALNMSIAFSPDGEYLIYDTTFQTASTRLEGDVYLWQLDPLRRIANSPGSIQGFVDDIQFSYCVDNEMQYVFDIAVENIVSQTSTGWCGIVDQSGDIVVTGEGYYFFLHLRDANTGDILTGSEIPAVWRTFSHDNSLLATSSVLNEIALWDVSEILEIGEIEIDDALAIMPHQGITVTAGGDVAFSPDDRYLAYSSLEGVFIYDIEEQAIVTELGDTIMSHSMVFSPDGDLLVTTNNVGSRCAESVIIWDTDRWDVIYEMQPSCVTNVAFNPEGTILATASDRGLIHLWGIPSDG